MSVPFFNPTPLPAVTGKGALLIMWLLQKKTCRIPCSKVRVFGRRATCDAGHCVVAIKSIKE